MSFYKQVGDAVICNVKEGQEVRFFIPECYFQAKSAIIVGEYVNLLGIFNYAIYENDKPISELKTFNFPTVFLCQPYTIVREREVKLTANSVQADYRILKFKNGDKLVVNVNVPQNIENVEEFFRLFVINGHIPDTIDYRDIWKYFIDAMALSGNSWAFTYQMFGILQSEVCRDTTDNTIPFRLSEAKKKKRWTDYTNVSIKDLPKYISPYVSLTSENLDDSIVAASLLTTAKDTPLERVLTGK